MPRASYRVWIGVERENDDPVRPSDEYTDIDPGFGSEGEFDTEEEAMEFAQRLHDVSQAMQGVSSGD